MASTSDSANDSVFRCDVTSMPKPARTPQGGLAIHGNLTRTGVLTYRMPDGSTRRELRHPDDVFHKDSTASFAHAPITVDHPGKVTPANYKRVTVGHVAGEPKREGNFLSGTLHVQDGQAIKDVEDKKLQELSCGYECGIDKTSGTYNGEDYDVKQVNIRGNHVAMGPKGWGRAGPDVRMHMDGGVLAGVSYDDQPSAAIPYVVDMADTKTIEQEALAELQAQFAKFKKDAAEAELKARQDAVDAETKHAEVLRAKDVEAAQLRAQIEMKTIQDARDQGTTLAKLSREQFESKLEATIQVRSDARRVFATPLDPKGEQWKHDGKNVTDIMHEIIVKLEPAMKLDAVDKIGAPGDEKSLALYQTALEPLYKMAMSHFDKAEASQRQLLEVTVGRRADNKKTNQFADDDGDEPSAEDARKKMQDKKRDAWKTPKRIDRQRMRDGLSVNAAGQGMRK
jgi:hypothetical protein